MKKQSVMEETSERYLYGRIYSDSDVEERFYTFGTTKGECQ